MTSYKHKLAVATLVWNKHKEILLVKNHIRGWEFPGGYVERGESIKEAAIREVKEETGMNIKITGIYGMDQDMKESTLVVIFAGKIINGTLAASHESLEVGFFTVDEAKRMITSEHFKERMIRCLSKNRSPFIKEIK